MGFFLRLKLRNNKKLHNRAMWGFSFVGPARYYRDTPKNQKKRQEALSYKRTL